MKNSQEFMKIHKNSLVMIFFHAIEQNSYFIKEEETYRAFHIRDFSTLWTQLGAQSFKTEELPINVPALGAQEKRILAF